VIILQFPLGYRTLNNTNTIFKAKFKSIKSDLICSFFDFFRFVQIKTNQILN